MYDLEDLIKLLFEENRLHLHDKFCFRKKLMKTRYKLVDATQNLVDMLSEEQRSLFDEMEHLNTDMRYKEYELYFTEGVKFGLSVGTQSIEIFNDPKLTDKTRELLEEFIKLRHSEISVKQK